MTRRGFLKALLSLPLVAAPVLWVKQKIAWKALFKTEVLNENWYCVIHPAQEAAFRGIHARSEWKMRFREYRASLREGMPPLTAQQIMADYQPLQLPIHDEIGTYEGIRFIRAERI